MYLLTIDLLLKILYDCGGWPFVAFGGVRVVGAARSVRLLFDNSVAWDRWQRGCERRLTPPQGLLTVLACGRGVGLVTEDLWFGVSRVLEVTCRGFFGCASYCIWRAAKVCALLTQGLWRPVNEGLLAVGCGSAGLPHPGPLPGGEGRTCRLAPPLSVDRTAIVVDLFVKI